MAEENKEERYRPGLLDLNLQISIVKNFHHLKYQCQLLGKLEEEFKESTTTICAVKNLLGAVYYFLQDYEHACETFGEVLKLDNANVNALRNLEIIYRELGHWSKADKYKGQINFDDPKLKATCFGEQAFAMMFDCHISSCEYERFKRSQKLFKLCLDEIINTGTEPQAVIQWHLWYAQLLSRLMNNCTDKQKEERFNYWIDGIEQCFLVKQKLCDCEMSDIIKKHYISVATAYLAIYGHKVDQDLKREILKQFADQENADVVEDDSESVSEELKISLKQQIGTVEDKLKSFPDESNAKLELLKALKGPEELFEDAVKIHDNVEALCRYALFVKGKSEPTLRDLENAENLVDKCIQGKNGGNWFAFTIKSGIFLSKCKNRYEKTSSQQCKEKKDTESVTDREVCKIKEKESGDDGEKKTMDSKLQTVNTEDVWHARLEAWLEESIKFGKMAGEINATSQIYSDLGEAYHWRALNQKKGEKRDSFFFQSLANFLHALQHAEGNRRPFVHVCHGDCLFDMKQYLPALESFKRAIECKTKKLEIVYTKLFECYIELQKKENETNNHDQMFADMAYWIKLGNEKFQNPKDWLDNILNRLKEQVQNDPERVAEIEMVLANAARKLNDKEAFPVSEQYLLDNTTFTLCLFGETLQLQSKDISDRYIEILDAENLRALNEDEKKKEKYVEIVAKAFTKYKEVCLKSPTKTYLKEEAFLIKAFKQLHEKCKDFAVLVGEKIQADNPLLGCFLLDQTGCVKSDAVIPESPVQDLSLRELAFYFKKLNPSEPTQQRKFRDCIDAFEKYIDKLCTNPVLLPEEEHGLSEPKVRKTKYEYDFSVVYSENDDDSQWVLHSLLPTLERKYGFRGYIENRDLPLGHSRFNILEMFEKCYKVIVIVTEKFCEDRWCNFIFQQVLYGRLGEHNIIPIQKTSEKKMPKELSTVISLMAVQNLDWERLVKALE